jgi:ribonuclease BN (tRNA processing enzyme)
MSELLMVGTSDAFGAGGRRQSAYLLRARNGSLLVDCGATTLSGLSALGVPREEIDAIAISHFHADHFGGIPLLLLATLYQDWRKKPLLVAGPRGIEQRVQLAARALGHPLEDHRFPYSLRFLELTPGAPADLGVARVRVFETNHSPDSCPHGFVIEAGAARIAYSGDTGWFDALPEHVAGSDLFVCECTQVRRDYAYHLSLEELSQRRAQFDCGQLVLTHLGAGMREHGAVNGFTVADDGMAFKL